MIRPHLVAPCLLVMLAILHPGCQQSPEAALALQPGTYLVDEADLADGTPDGLIRQRLKLRVSLEGVTTLAAALERIQQRTQTPMFIEWLALEAAGIEKISPLAGEYLGDAPADDVLARLLRTSSEFEPIVYVIRNGQVIVSTRRMVQRFTTVRVYDVRDLIMPTRFPATSPAALPDRVAIYLYLPDTSPPTTTLFSREDTLANEMATTRQDNVEALSTTIQDNVGNQAEWSAYGGEIGSLRHFDGDLIIRTTPENHEVIALLLKAMRQSRTASRVRMEKELARGNHPQVKDLLDTLGRMEKKFDAWRAMQDAERKTTEPQR